MNRRTHHNQCSPRDGFSLLELSVGLIASSILLVGLSGSLYLSLIHI